MSAWTLVPKPAESSVTSFAFGDGTPIGLLLALTQATQVTTTSITSGWTDIAKPTSSLWSAVPKATSSVWSVVPKPTT